MIRINKNNLRAVCEAIVRADHIVFFQKEAMAHIDFEASDLPEDDDELLDAVLIATTDEDQVDAEDLLDGEFEDNVIRLLEDGTRIELFDLEPHSVIQENEDRCPDCGTQTSDLYAQPDGQSVCEFCAKENDHSE